MRAVQAAIYTPRQSKVLEIQASLYRVQIFSDMLSIAVNKGV